MSTIWRATSKNHGWVVHFANHRDLNSFLYANGASHYEVDRLEYSKKQDIINMLNCSAVLAWMNGSSKKRDRRKKAQENLQEQPIDH